MKTADLKAGELYAVRRQSRPCLLLSTDVYREQRHSWSDKPNEYQLAPTGTKPVASKSYASPTSYGFITLAGEADVLAALDVPATLAAVLADSRTGRPDGVGIEFVTSAAAILGRYDEYVKAERERLDAAQARRDRERQKRLALVDRHNAVAARLNAVLGEDVIPRKQPDGYGEPMCVELTFAVAEELADLLAYLTTDQEN